jgi:hypothetical protein
MGRGRTREVKVETMGELVDGDAHLKRFNAKRPRRKEKTSGCGYREIRISFTWMMGSISV